MEGVPDWTITIDVGIDPDDGLEMYTWDVTTQGDRPRLAAVVGTLSLVMYEMLSDARDGKWGGDDDG